MKRCLRGKWKLWPILTFYPDICPKWRRKTRLQTGLDVGSRRLLGFRPFLIKLFPLPSDVITIFRNNGTCRNEFQSIRYNNFLFNVLGIFPGICTDLECTCLWKVISAAGRKIPEILMRITGPSRKFEPEACKIRRSTTQWLCQITIKRKVRSSVYWS
jgi:hypothetical protein